MGAHAILAPSKAHRWVVCPGCIAFCADYPEEQDQEAADNGTLAHEMGSALLQGGCLPQGHDKEMYSYVKVYVEDIFRRATGKILMVEQRVYIEPFTSEKDGFGTSDAILFDPETGILEVRDLKYGMIVVYAEENEQLMLYALGAKHLLETVGYEVKRVILAIHQPRRDHYDEWEVSVDRLLEFGSYAYGRGTIALSAFAGEELHPSIKACEYCPGRQDCPAFTKYVHKVTYEEFSDAGDGKLAVSRPIEGEVTPAELDMVEAWVKAKRAWIFEQLQAGTKFVSWKMVEGRGGNRKFTDETVVEALLKQMRFKASEIKETTLKPLTELEKMVGKERWKQFLPFITQKPGQPQMAPMSDKRPELNSKIADEFDIVPQKEFSK
jgi:hypothetical protein